MDKSVYLIVPDSALSENFPKSVKFQNELKHKQ